MRIFTKESLELLRQKVDLVDVISSYVRLKRAGSVFKGLCPFHDEKTPSFIVNSGDSHYHCFGCGAHGDAIEFLMNCQKMTFVDAVEFLAERFQVSLQQTHSSVDGGINKTVLKDALYKAGEFFHFNLLHTKEGHEALKYLYDRGMDLDFIKTFEIGFAPKKQGLFQKIMMKRKVSMETLETVGLMKKLQSGQIKDFFNDRIMIPIKDPMGNIIGFSARKFKEDTFGPKYINTPETPLFKKSRVLFGFSYCRKKIARERRAIIVEGQFDALRLVYEGISIAVAGQGTAFGEGHVKQLLALGINKVYLALDADKAGKEAALKIGHIFQKEAVEVFVVSFPEETDPDTFVREYGLWDFIELLKSADDYLTFMVKLFSERLDLNSPAGKNELINMIVSRIKEWDNPLMIHESLKKIAKLTNIPEAVIGENQGISPNLLIKKSGKVPSSSIDPDRVMEADFLRWVTLVGDSGNRFIEIAQKNINENYFKIDVSRKLYRKCLDAYKESDKRAFDLFSLGIDLDDTDEQLFLSEIFQRKINREKAEDGFLQALQKILDRYWLEEREHIKIKIQSGKISEEDLLVLAKKFDEIKNKRPEILL